MSLNMDDGMSLVSCHIVPEYVYERKDRTHVNQASDIGGRTD